jgi:7-carboxy-7-deazaguanine synthase
VEYKVVERFISINGEGEKAGQLAVFIRFAGCNLDCSYCDTRWANKEDVEFTWMTQDAIYEYIQSTEIRNVTLTGGEPLLQEGMYELLSLLARDSTLNIEIETNGSVNLEAFTKITPIAPVFTMDYKLDSSNMEDQMCIENFNYLKPADSVKFVVGSRKDLEIVEYLTRKFDLMSKAHVHLSPVLGKIELDALVEYMKQNKMNGVTLKPQLHKFIWHPDTRGV